MMRDFINLFYDLAQDANKNGQFEYASALENAGSMVNNVGHGLAPLVWIPRVRDLMLKNLDQDWDWVTDEHRRGWKDAVDLFDSEIEILESKSS